MCLVRSREKKKRKKKIAFCFAYNMHNMTFTPLHHLAFPSEQTETHTYTRARGTTRSFYRQISWCKQDKGIIRHQNIIERYKKKCIKQKSFRYFVVVVGCRWSTNFQWLNECDADKRNSNEHTTHITHKDMLSLSTPHPHTTQLDDSIFERKKMRNKKLIKKSYTISAKKSWWSLALVHCCCCFAVICVCVWTLCSRSAYYMVRLMHLDH